MSGTIFTSPPVAINPRVKWEKQFYEFDFRFSASTLSTFEKRNRIKHAMQYISERHFHFSTSNNADLAFEYIYSTNSNQCPRGATIRKLPRDNGKSVRVEGKKKKRVEKIVCGIDVDCRDANPREQYIFFFSFFDHFHTPRRGFTTRSFRRGRERTDAMPGARERQLFAHFASGAPSDYNGSGNPGAIYTTKCGLMLAVGGGSLFIAFRLETAAKSKRVAERRLRRSCDGKNEFNAICGAH